MKLREEIDKIVGQVEHAAKSLHLVFSRNHFTPFDYASFYTATFSWKSLNARKVERMEVEAIKQLLEKLAPKVLFVATESEQHYSIYNLWLRIELVDGTVYMIKLLSISTS